MRFGIREFILILILLAVPVSSYWWVFRPVNKELEAAEQETRHKQEMLEKLRTETARSADLQRANNEIKKSIDSIESRLPSGKEMDSIIRQVSDLALAVGLPAPTIKSSIPLTAAMYKEQPIKMSIRGDFRAFYEFLLRVEQLPRITRIPEMKVTRDEDTDGVMKADFTLSIYFQDQPAAGTSTPATSPSSSVPADKKVTAATEP